MAPNLRDECAAWGNKAHPCKSLLRVKASEPKGLLPNRVFSMRQGRVARDLSSVLHVPSPGVVSALQTQQNHGHVIARRSKSTQQVMASTTVPEFVLVLRHMHPRTADSVTGLARIVSDFVACRTADPVATGRNPRKGAHKSRLMEASLYLLLCHRERAVWQIALPWMCRPLWHFAFRFCFCPEEVFVFSSHQRSTRPADPTLA